MPTYRYRCGRCGEELEVWQSITDEPLTEHEACGGDLRKVMSAAGIVLKGSGFYKTDSRSGNGKSTKDKDSKDKDSKDKGSKEPSSTGSSGSSSGSTKSGSTSSKGSTSGSTGSS